MAAILPITSAEYLLQTDGSRTGDQLAMTGGNLKLASAVYTVATAGTGTVSLLKLPAGRIRVWPYLSIFSYGDTGQATADLDIGHAAYTNEDGTAVAADVDEFVASSDLGGSAADSNMGVVTEGGVYLTSAQHFVELNSQEGIVVTASVDTADADIGTVLNVTVAYTHIS